MRVLLALLFILFTGAALAVEPDEMLDDPVLEARAQELDELLRCVVCQSQSLAESNAPLAKDLRLLVRERLVEGDTNDEVIAYIVERYGDYVLLKPPFQQNTLFLWFFPAVIFAIGVGGLVFYLRQPGRTSNPKPLSSEEEEKLRRLMDGEDE